MRKDILSHFKNGKLRNMEVHFLSISIQLKWVGVGQIEITSSSLFIKSFHCFDHCCFEMMPHSNYTSKITLIWVHLHGNPIYRFLIDWNTIGIDVIIYYCKFFAFLIEE